ncbi:cation-translocating P-type ATPase [Lapidilactobacillus achengensis]|uniref:Cation-translocating P-type ATPase n=1 Tax=Lapidilactobacillus achengensis TaxID=2486000 RepID=A0ABW1UQ88_9LACO|nr:cation-transporting P-type ATPase [Lapidilactobacillus achengensis]
MFYNQHRKEVLEKLQTSRFRGLTETEAAARLERDGRNELVQKQPDPGWKIFIRSFKEPIVIVLWIAVGLAILSAVYDFQVNGDFSHGKASLYEAIAIFALIIGNAVLSYVQETKAQKSLDSLKQLADHQVAVLRDEDWQKVDAAELVAGDIVSVKMGDFLDADLRWLATNELQINESHLTGEAEPVAKTRFMLADDTQLGDRTNMGFSGSTVVNGNGVGVVVATGMTTELGHIANLLDSVETKKTPIEQTMANLTRKLMYVAAAIVVIVLGYGIAKEVIATGQLTVSGVADNLSTAIALAVAAIPDALPVVLSIVLTIGATSLAKSKGLIKSLNSVETLGATTFIASDKTGTLTKNEMTVTDFWANGIAYEVDGNGYEPIGEIEPVDEADVGRFDYKRFVHAAVLNNEASVSQNEHGQYRPFGNPTDVSLIVLGQKDKVFRDDLLNQTGQDDYDILRVFPFDSTRKMMSVVVKDGTQYKVLTKGAPDVILTKTDQVWLGDQMTPVATAKEQVETQIHHYAQQALRTLAVAERTISLELAENGTQAELEQHLQLLGIAGIIDPPRAEVKRSVAVLAKAGVNVVMITGDHAETARAIAYRLGIVHDEQARVVQGREIEAMSDAELAAVVPEIRVYARVSPEHKQRVVKALQGHQEIVAMTGDGVNDAPALRAADIGIAMGINGTEVTKDSADLILMDDKFTTIEKSVAAGRTIFGNIKNFIRHELTTNVAEVLSLLLGVFFITKPIGQISELTPTLTALMVLWVNMISDALPSFALGYDEAERNIMSEKPRDTKQSVFANGLLSRVLIRGVLMGGLVFAAFVWAAQAGYSAAEAQTIAFLTLVFGQLWHVFDARSTRTLFRRNPFSNLHLVAAVSFAAVASLVVTMFPLFTAVFGTVTLTWQLYLAVIFIPALPTLILSGLKEIFPKITLW